MGTFYSNTGTIKLKPGLDAEALSEKLYEILEKQQWDDFNTRVVDDDEIAFQWGGDCSGTGASEADDTLDAFLMEHAAEGVACEYEYEGNSGVQYFGPNPKLAEFKHLDREMATLMARRSQLQTEIARGDT